MFGVADGELHPGLVGQRGVNGLIRAMDVVSQDGYLYTKGGRIVADLSVADQFLYGAGFSPTTVKEAQTQIGLEKRVGGLYTEAKKKVTDTIYMAIRMQEHGDDGAMLELARAAVDRFNAEFTKDNLGVQLDYEKEFTRLSKKAAKERELFESKEIDLGSAAKSAFVRRYLGNSNAN